MELIRVYQVNSLGIYLPGVAVYAEPSQFAENEYLYPAGTRTQVPPTLSEHQAARTTGPELDAPWEVVDDYVGTTYWLADRSCVTITDYGVKPPSGALMTDPGPTIKEQAAALLTSTQSIVMACYEAGIPFPADWRTYRATLRAIASGNEVAPLPAQPAPPSGI